MWFKVGHTLDQCWHRFHEEHVPEEKHVSAAVKTYNIGTSWYMDSDTTDNVAGDIEKLSMKNKYKGTEQSHTLAVQV